MHRRIISKNINVKLTNLKEDTIHQELNLHGMKLGQYVNQKQLRLSHVSSLYATTKFVLSILILLRLIGKVFLRFPIQPLSVSTVNYKLVGLAPE